MKKVVCQTELFEEYISDETIPFSTKFDACNKIIRSDILNNFSKIKDLIALFKEERRKGEIEEEYLYSIVETCDQFLS